jgi:hypothetical protein
MFRSNTFVTFSDTYRCVARSKAHNYAVQLMQDAETLFEKGGTVTLHHPATESTKFRGSSDGAKSAALYGFPLDMIDST